MIRIAALLLAGLLAAGVARGETPPSASGGRAEAAALRAAHLERRAEALRLLKAGNAAEAAPLLRPLVAALEDEDDLELLRDAYELSGIAGDALNDPSLAIAGSLQTVLLGHLLAPLDAPDNVSAELGLAETYRRRERDVSQFVVLANVLAAVEAARRAGPLAADLAEAAMIAPALMGQLLRAGDRPELALFFFARARSVADADPDTARKLDAVIAEAREEIGKAPLPEPDGCIADAALDEARMAACLKAADRAFARGDVARADLILSNLLKDVPEGSLRAERYAPARDLLLLRLVTRDAGDAELLASAELVANYLASINEVPAAAVIAARVAHAAIDGDSYSPRIAGMCGHIARRAAREGSPDLARRLLVLQRLALRAGLPAAPLLDLPREARERTLDDILLRIETVHIAAAGRARLAAVEQAGVERAVATLDPDIFTEIERLTVGRYASSTDYVFPTFAAALELKGRLALRLPADDPRRDEARLGWISALYFRGGTAEADAMADAMIRDLRAAPDGREAMLIALLAARASSLGVSNPEASAQYSRQAYEIASRLPGQEALRIELLLDMASDAADAGLSRALVAQAQKLREATPELDLKTRARLDLKRSYQAYDDDDTARAVALAEAAVASLVAAGRKDSQAIVDPADRLAQLYAALGRMDDARRTYETYVFPQSNPTLVGEERALSDQLDLANLEAYYAPDGKTLTTLATLLDRARRRLEAGSDLFRRIHRAQAFALHGLGEGAKARTAAHAALATDRPRGGDTANAQEDRKLLEALVGADWLARQASTSP